MTAPSLSKIWFLSDASYGVSGLIGVLTYSAYASLNDAWMNPVLVMLSLYMFLCIPWYSKFSNRVEAVTGERTGLITVGHVSRFLVQLAFNLVLLWVLLAGRVLVPSGLEGIGGFFAAAAWVTVVSQGGQYLANGLGHRGIGTPDRNVVLAFFASVFVNALAVSGLAWIQPTFVTVSLSLGIMVLTFGIVSDTRLVIRKAVYTIGQYWCNVR